MARGWLVLVVLATGCTYDFDAYLPHGADASSDAPKSDSGPVDTGCTPPAPSSACYATAKSCAGDCATTRTTCESACGNPGCRKNCQSQEAVCRDKCVSDCSGCTATEGCAAPTQCRAALG